MGSFSPSSLFASLLLLFSNSRSSLSETSYIPKSRAQTSALPRGDVDLLEFPLNLEYLEAEFFLWGALGYGLDKEAPALTMGGPPPVGAKKANLCPFVRDIITQFAYQEVGHIRAIQKTVKGFPRPFLDLTASNFDKIIENAMGRKLEPPFDPYANSLNYLIASYIIPYVGLTGYVGANPNLISPQSKRLVAGLLGVESAQDAVIRNLLYIKATPRRTLQHHGGRAHRPRLRPPQQARCGSCVKDEGIEEGAEGKIAGNVIAGDENSLAFDRTPEEILKVVYGGGSASAPGGFFPKGAGGRIARSFLDKVY
ncbi:uncharacterized protein A4U43_C09F15660 [Asparagus officinalis]|uniref:Desiccation-related protein PCC13-62 n=1 Tax=Asparagus officinalis TaxID=4686 RepID=A0A5P1E885_ASPOF|nr:uncharacterized protein A4U43_C09F15660 [Asparagus officinalis]